MDTVESQEQNAEMKANKRKRADTNPDDSGSPATSRIHNVPLPPSLSPNHLGITTNIVNGSPQHHAPTNSGSQLLSLPLDMNVSTGILQDEAMTSTPRTSNHSPLLTKQGRNRLIPPANPQANPLTPNVKDVEVTGFLGDNPLIGIDPRVKNSWKGIQDFKALVYPHDASFDEDNKVIIGTQMERAVSLHLHGLECTITAPTTDAKFNNRNAENRRPWVYLISKVTEEGLDTLLRDKFISNEHASLHVIPFNPPPSNYIGRIKNLTLDATSHQTVTRLIRNSIMDDNMTTNFITDFISAHHDLIPPTVLKNGTSINWILDSIRAYHIYRDGIMDKPYSHWKWYIQSPTAAQEHAEKWTKTLAKVKFDAGIYGVGETTNNTKCTRCKSTNHSDTECPFTQRSQFVSPHPTRGTANKSRGGRGGKRGRGNTRGRN